MRTKRRYPLLASHFIEIAVAELKCPRPRLTRAGIDKLVSYEWPGNIRELCNVIQRAAILAQGGDLDFNVPPGKSLPAIDADSSTQPPQVRSGYLTEAELRERKRDNLLIVLQKTGWKIKGTDGAAELLGIKPTTLISQIARMGLRKPA